MAKTKSELEFDRNQYWAIISSAKAAIKTWSIEEALDLAVSALDHLDGMMQFERRYAGQVFDSVDCVDIILSWAPLLLDYEKLNRVEAVLKGQRRVEKNTEADLGAKLAIARSVMHDTHRLCSLLENSAPIRQNSLAATLGGTSDHWWELADALSRLGIISRKHNQSTIDLSLATQMFSPCRGKCPECGAFGHAAKIDVLSKHTCSGCQNAVSLVLCPLSESNQMSEQCSS